jgi:hypothetical protein
MIPQSDSKQHQAPWAQVGGRRRIGVGRRLIVAHYFHQTPCLGMIVCWDVMNHPPRRSGEPMFGGRAQVCSRYRHHLFGAIGSQEVRIV